MMKEYKLINILHSGQKGERGTLVTQEKYDGMIGSLVILNIDEINIGDSFTFWFENNMFYKYWTTSPVLSFINSETKQKLIIETLNSLYTFDYIGEFKRKRVEVNLNEVQNL